MDLLCKTLTCFSNTDALKSCMQEYDAVGNTFNRDFYTITLDKHPQVNACIKSILDQLNVPPHQHGRYLHQKLSVYACLVELNETVNDDNLAQFIQLLHEKKQARWKNMLLSCALVSASGLIPFFVFQLSVLQQVLSVASLMSGGGLVYAIGIAAYTAYDLSLKSGASFYQLFKDNFFSVAKNALSIAAWSIMIIAAVTTPLVSLLFVLADAMLVIQELSKLAYVYLHDQLGNKDKLSLLEQQTQAREQTNFGILKHSAWVNFAAAVIMTGIIAAWCFAPGGIFVVAGAIAAIGIVYVSKNYAIKEHEKKMKEVMQDNFNTIEQTEAPGNMMIGVHNNVKMLLKLKNNNTHTITQQVPLITDEHRIPGLKKNSVFCKGNNPVGENNSHHTPRPVK